VPIAIFQSLSKLVCNAIPVHRCTTMAMESIKSAPIASAFLHLQRWNRLDECRARLHPPVAVVTVRRVYSIVTSSQVYVTIGRRLYVVCEGYTDVPAPATVGGGDNDNDHHSTTDMAGRTVWVVTITVNGRQTCRSSGAVECRRDQPRRREGKGGKEERHEYQRK